MPTGAQRPATRWLRKGGLKTENPLLEQEAIDIAFPYLADLSAGIGTLRLMRRLPGFTGPFPSTSHDKAVLFSC